MKKYNWPVLLLAIVVCMVFAAPLRANYHVIKISSDPWKPWVLGTEGKAATGGWAVESANELFSRIGLETETIIYPYERCLQQMKEGSRDVLLMAKKTPEREKYMLYSDVAATEFQSIYFSTERMPDFEWNDWTDLKPYSIGAVRGFNYGDFESAAEKLAINIELVSNDTKNINKLLSGRVDLILLNQSTANHYMQQHPDTRGKFQPATKPISKAELHFALSKKGHATALLSQINAALRDMKADGTMDRIVRLSGNN